MKPDNNRLLEKLASASEALELIEKKFKFLFDYSSDEIFVSDLKGNFLEVNQVACDSLGYTKKEMLSMNFKSIKTPKYREFVLINIKKILEKKRYTYESKHITKDGKIFSVEMKSRIIDYYGETAIISVARDISERKELENKILHTIIVTEEKERKRFANDLHDGLSPILSAIKLYTDLLKKDSFKQTSKEEILSNIEELVELSISSAKEISNNITPSILHDFGLSKAIEKFCGYIDNTKSINITTKTNEYKFSERSIEESILYQTTKELINNTLKHASAKNIRLELKSSDNLIIMHYSDDGIGLDLKDHLKNSSGLGLNNIINKIKSIKGNCDFYNGKNAGMKVLISVKLNK